MAETLQYFYKQHKEKPIEALIPALNTLIQAYVIDERGEPPKLPQLPTPWTAISIGGDEMKLIAAAESLGISVKRYDRPRWTERVAESYRLIYETIQVSGFPLLLPIAIYNDALVFPYIQNTHTWNSSVEAMNELKRILFGIKLPMPLAHELEILGDSSGNIHYTDPFEDHVGIFFEYNSF